MPPECQIDGALTFLVNEQGDSKSISQADGSIMDWPYKATIGGR